MGAATRMALRQANALHVDCRRDLRLARVWGFPADRRAAVLPGAGGVRAEVFYPPPQSVVSGEELRVVNPRGFRAYVRSDTFFRAIPRVLARMPGVRFACTGMAGEKRAMRWVEELNISASVDLLPPLSLADMGDLFRQAQVSVSPSTHDGTPNTLLEAMACGCFPIAGDLESIREWITPGVNGLLVDPGDPQALAEAILLALEQPGFRWRAGEINLQIVGERAEYGRVMAEAEVFYQEVMKIIYE
jgi:glycosyltransferase involved in cell wall biosynthesis